MARTGQSNGTEPDGPAPGRRGWARTALAAAAVVVVLTGVALLVTQLRHDTTPVGHSGPYPGTPNGRTATPGWRLVSSLGLEFEVPAEWGTNDATCGSATHPTVLRALGAVPACAFPEPADVPVAELVSTAYRNPDDLPAGYVRRAVTVDGVPAQRADGHRPDGRAEAVLTVPSLSARLKVRGATPDVTEHVLTSVQVVTADSLGCATPRPSTARPPAPTGLDTLVPSAVTEVDVCYYGEPDYYTNPPRTDGPLEGSVALTGAAAQQLASALNAGPPGRNPDSHSCLAPKQPIRPDAVLLFRSAGRPLVPVYLTSSGCWNRGFDNGGRVVQLTWPLARLAYDQLHTGYGLTGDIPGLPDQGNSSSPEAVAPPPSPNQPPPSPNQLPGSPMQPPPSPIGPTNT
jgi:hypothetical protein